MIEEIITFGYRNGKPAKDTRNYILDVRNLKGPDKALRDKYVGTNKDVRTSILNDKRNQAKLNFIWDSLEVFHSSPDKIIINIGCEKGKHRSVTIGIVATQKYTTISNLHHRDIMM